MYMWRASRGSMLMECSFGPSGVPSFSPPVHFRYIGLSLKPVTGAQVSPLSSLLNRPCGEVPAYQTPASLGCAGWSQNTWLTESPFSPSAAFGNAGGREASRHVRP